MDDLSARLGKSLAGHYRIERELGSGGMATVFYGTDLRLGRPVAIKVLRPELAQAVGAERFRQEIDIAAGLTHPGILPVHESGEADGLFYYVMPFVAGDTLRHRMERERQLPVDDALEILRDVAEALDAAHQAGIVHRDIKPENILLSSGRAVVSDFGIARMVSGDTAQRLTETGLAIGTPTYMSPEQAAGQRDIDLRVDVYSLGCVAWEMLGGQAPFTGPSPQAVLARHALDPVPRISTVRPVLGDQVQSVLEQAMAKVPADRFRTAGEFVSALERAVAAPPIRLDRWSRWRVAAVVIPLLAAGVLWTVDRGNRTPSIRRLAVLPLVNLMNDATQDYFVDGMQEAIIAELASAGLPVIGRTSVMPYRSAPKPVREIASELDVDAVIEGSVWRSGDSVVIETRLVDGRSQASLWSGSFAAEMREVRALHRRITLAIAGQVRLALSPTTEAMLQAAPEVDPAVYEEYLRGLFHAYKFTPTDLTAALGYFEQALAKDPGYAPAWLGVSRVWSYRRVLGLLPPAEAGLRMSEALGHAWQLDSTQADAAANLAAVAAWGEWDWVRAEQLYRRAIALDSNRAESRLFFGHFLAAIGRPEEALPQIERGMALDPRNAFFQSIAGAGYMFSGRYRQAEAQFRKTIAMAPEFPLAHRALARTLHHLGHYDEALVEVRTFFRILQDQEVVAALDAGAAEGGYARAMQRAAQVLEARADTSFVLPSFLAAFWDNAGDPQRAVTWLERGFDVRDHMIVYLDVEPFSDSLRALPRFQALRTRLRLPAAATPH